MNNTRQTASLFLLIVVPVLALWQVSFFAYTMKWDMVDQFFPCRYLMSEAFKQHSLPLWCPYINFGYPSYADPQGGFFYPITWMMSIFPGYSVYTISAEFILHILIAAISFYGLTRSFRLARIASVVFAICYSLSGLFIGNATHLSWVISLAWMPAVLLSYRNLLSKPGWQPALSFALSGYLFVCGGYPAFFIILGYFLAGYGAYHVIGLLRAKRFTELKFLFLFVALGGVILFILLSGYVYALWHTMPLIDRGEGVTLRGANTFPFTPYSFISFLFPFATTCQTCWVGTDITMANVYAGLLLFPLMLFALFKTKTSAFQKAFLGFGIISLLAATGEYTFVRTWLYYLPGMNMFRHAALFRGFAVMSFLLLAASGFDWWLQKMNEQPNVFVKRTLFAFLALLTFIFVVADIANRGYLAFPPNLSPEKFIAFHEQKGALTHLLPQCLIQITLLSAVTAIFLRVKRARLKVFAICVILILDMVIAAQLNISATVVDNTNPSHLTEALQNLKQDFVAESNQPMSSFRHVGDGNTKPIWYNLSIFKKVPAYDGFNNFKLKGLQQMSESPLLTEVISHPLCFFSTSEALAEDTSVKYRLTRFSPQRVEVNYSSQAASQVVLLQNNFPGWEVTCDTNHLSIEKAYGLFIKGKVPAGSHRLSFVFEPFWPRFFFWFTCAGFFISAIALLVLYFRNTPSSV